MLFAGVNIGRRFKLKEKEVFLKETIKLCELNGLNTSFQTKRSPFMNVCNLVVQDIRNAKIIVVCAYDTPEKALLPKMKYYPFNPSLNTREEMKNLVVQIICASMCFLLINFLLHHFESSSIFLKTIKFFSVVVLGYFCFRFIHPSGNLVNFSRSSAAVAATLKIMEKVENKNVSYVFLDRNCASYEGIKLLKQYINDNQLIIYLDNLASGPKTVVAHSGNVEVSMLLEDGWIEKEYNETNNLLGYFKKAIMISCGNIKDKKFYVENTKTENDYEVDMDRLNLIVEKIIKLLEEVR